MKDRDKLIAMAIVTIFAFILICCYLVYAIKIESSIKVPYPEVELETIIDEPKKIELQSITEDEQMNLITDLIIEKNNIDLILKKEKNMNMITLCIVGTTALIFGIGFGCFFSEEVTSIWHKITLFKREKKSEK